MSYFIDKIVKYFFYIINKFYQNSKVYLLFHWKIRNFKKINIVIGASETKFTDWISTEQFFFDITSSKSWKRNFSGIKIDKLLAEHVFEHLTEDQIKAALFNAHNYLKKGGVLRIAVPDGYHPSKYVIDLVKPNGADQGSDDHKVLLNIDIFKKLLNKKLFSLVPLEYFDKYGLFHKNLYNDHNGFIKRSSKNYIGRFTESKKEYTKMINSVEKKLKPQFNKMNISYTSLLIELIKI